MSQNELVQIENAEAAPPRRGGPTSAAGKARSSLNAVRHNLTGRAVLLPGDDVNLYHSYLQRQINAWQPANDKEHELVRIMVDELWRMRRIREMEDGIYGLGHFEKAGEFDTDDPETHALFTAARVYSQ